jgi:hypothetical protein
VVGSVRAKACRKRWRRCEGVRKAAALGAALQKLGVHSAIAAGGAAIGSVRREGVPETLASLARASVKRRLGAALQKFGVHSASSRWRGGSGHLECGDFRRRFRSRRGRLQDRRSFGSVRHEGVPETLASLERRP